MRVVAFLRAINIGGHNVKMVQLRELFEDMGFDDVETFIASGNVIFSTRVRDLAPLQKKVEAHLHASLGYEVRTFLRTDAEVARVASYRPFPAAKMKAAGALQVGFLQAPLTPQATQAYLGLRTPDDDLHVNDREIYWMSTTNQSASKLFGTRWERILGAPTTFRTLNMVVRLAEKFPPSLKA